MWDLDEKRIIRPLIICIFRNEDSILTAECNEKLVSH